MTNTTSRFDASVPLAEIETTIPSGPPGGSGRDLVVVGRRPLGVAAPTAHRQPVAHDRPVRDRDRVFVRAGSGVLAKLAFGRSPALADAAGESVAPAAGVLSSSRPHPFDSSALFLTGAVVGGAGPGVAFLGGLCRRQRRFRPDPRAR
jgi:hypothetical protein